MKRRKNAPNVRKQGNAQSVEIYFGTLAWDIAKQHKETPRTAEQIALDNALPAESLEPIILASKELAQLEQLQIAPPTAEEIRLYRSATAQEIEQDRKGETSVIQAIITAICLQLATTTNAKSVQLFDETGGLLEDLSGQIKRLRESESDRELAEVIAKGASSDLNPNSESKTIQISDKRSTEREITQAFLQWLDKPLGRDVERAETLEFNGIYWQAVNDELLERKIIAFYDEMESDYTSRKIESIARLVKKSAELVQPPNPALIGFQNGVINKFTGEFLAHSKTHFLRGVEPYDCNPNSTATPLFDNWLYFVAEDNEEKRLAIMAGFYMILTNRYNWHLFLEITGIARSGKSVMAEIATVINGEQNTGVITLKDMEDPVKRGMLLNRTLAYSPDQGYYKGDGSYLKQITGNDPVDVKLLYINTFKARLGVVFIMTTNEAMLFTDKNGGVSSRRVIIPFNRQIPAEKRDVDFISKVRLEVYGIIQKVLGQFSDPKQARQILIRYQEKNEGKAIKQNGNHLIDFLSHFELSNDRKRESALDVGSARNLHIAENLQQAKTLYSAYCLYCDCMNQKPLPVIPFRNALPDSFREVGETTPFQVTKYNGTLKTNAYWRNKQESFNLWGV